MNQLPMIKLAGLPELMAYAEDFALWTMKDKGSCRPCLFFTDAAGQAGVFMFGNGEFDDREKNEFVNVARAICIAQNAIACVFISEGWISVGNSRPGETKEEAQDRLVREKGMPSEDFERQEVMMIAGESRTRRICKTVPIVRSGNGKFWNFGDSEIPPLETDKGDSYEGRFAHILPWIEAPPELREMAKMFLIMKGMKQVLVAAPKPDQKP